MSTLAKNKKAYLDYEILETCEAGIVLAGFEVKSVKLGHISLKGAYVSIKDNEAYLLNAHISPYQPKNMPRDYDPTRSRKLLLKRAEINTLIGKSKSQGLTLLPLSVYAKKGKIKIAIGIGKGKKKHEKRESLKKKTAMKEMDRAMKLR
ncbi:MAG: SsrA-binding protein SmpB [Candidatus Spechtbacterales bacterium]